MFIVTDAKPCRAPDDVAEGYQEACQYPPAIRFGVFPHGECDLSSEAVIRRRVEGRKLLRRSEFCGERLRARLIAGLLPSAPFGVVLFRLFIKWLPADSLG